MIALKNKPVIVIGAGGHSSVLLDMLILEGREIIGVTDLNKHRKEKIFGDFKIIGDDSEIFKYNKSEIELVNGIGPSTKNVLRKKISEKFSNHGYHFSKVIHPSVVFSKNTEFKSGCQIMAGVIIQSNVEIGKNTVINTGSILDHDCHIYDNSHIAPGSILCGSVKVYDNVFVGAGSVIIENLTLEANSVLGAGVTLRRNLKNSEIYTGKLKT